MKKPVIEFRDFGMRYASQQKPTLYDINLTIYEGEKVLILGPSGSGKSTLMKRVAAAAEGRCEQIELIHCSSDADSLDGVILHDVKTSIADGTSPHAGVPNIINLTSAGGRGKLLSLIHI